MTIPDRHRSLLFAVRPSTVLAAGSGGCIKR